MFDLSYARFCQLKNLLREKMEQDYRDCYILEAFNAWLGGAGAKKTFKQYIKHLGLEKETSSKDQEMSQEDTKRTVAQNLENAKRILLLDKQNRQA